MLRRSFRLSASIAFTAGIDVNELENLLVKVIPQFSNDEELVNTSEAYRGLACRSRLEGLEWCDDESDAIVDILNTLLLSSVSLPSTTVAQVHSYIGLFLERQNRHGCAIESFLKSLWIQAADEGIPPVFVAIAEHRLGRAYGNDGNYSEAIPILEKALDRYTKANVREDQQVVIQAQGLLKKFREDLLMSTNGGLLRKNSSDNDQTKLEDNILEQVSYQALSA